MKEACVRIDDIERLKRDLDGQIGCEGRMESCRYTNDHQRDHFLKSIDDSWQYEYRIFWSHTESRAVWIQPGTARLIKL